ncbi:MAG: nucleotidyltransferase family protein [Pseudomonadota bacterium]
MISLGTSNPAGTAGIVPAAGLSTRMGRPKQLLAARGRILLAHVLKTVLDSPLDPVILVLGRRAREIEKALAGPEGLEPADLARVSIVINPLFRTGQASSIKAGLGALGPEVQAALFVMGDQAGLKQSVIAAVLERGLAAPGPVAARPYYGGVPDGPVFWSKKFFPLLMTLEGDQGGRSLFSRLAPEELIRLDLPAEDRPADVDDPDDFERWRLELGGKKIPGPKFT